MTNRSMWALAAVATTAAVIAIGTYLKLREEKDAATPDVTPEPAAKAKPEQGIKNIRLTIVDADKASTLRLYRSYQAIGRFLKRHQRTQTVDGQSIVFLDVPLMLSGNGMVMYSSELSQASADELMSQPEKVIERIGLGLANPSTIKLWVSQDGDHPTMVYVEDGECYSLFCRDDGTFVVSMPTHMEGNSSGYLFLALDVLLSQLKGHIAPSTEV